MKLVHIASALIVIALAVPALGKALPSYACEGRPEFGPASATGAFVWKDKSWLHVRFTSERELVRFHGLVCVEGRIHSVGTVILEGGDSISVDADARCLEFSFMNKRHVDGFKFKTTSSRVEFDMSINSDQLRTDQIWIGRNSGHPDENPFFIDLDRQTPHRSQ
ncbi:MAG: hypothetical protein JRF63_07560 [Deltaproteobacteria bacterium]|nr:hypothetical protein [Deltaproteobacteria bacterium]